MPSTNEGNHRARVRLLSLTHITLYSLDESAKSSLEKRCKKEVEAVVLVTIAGTLRKGYDDSTIEDFGKGHLYTRDKKESSSQTWIVSAGMTDIHRANNLI